MAAANKRETENFTLLEAVDGVFAAMEKASNTGSNAGIIDLGGTSVVFDTFLNIDAAKELAALCREATGRDAAYVVNSHYHTDHIAGNAAFPGAAVISTAAAKERIGKARADFEAEKESYPEEIVKTESALLSASDPEEIRNLQNTLLFLKNLVKPGVEFRSPDIAFTGELVLHGSKRGLRLLAFDMAHTGGDAAAYLPEEKVCFMGDLLCKGVHPWLGNGDPESLLHVLDWAAGLGAEHYVPGHGALAGHADVLLEKQYIEELLLLTEKKGSPNESDYALSDISPVFRQWDSLCFSWNIRFLLNRQKQQ